MDCCEVLIVGGGPAGSACAWKLRGAGLDVVVMDASRFPRDKVCAGWITPQIVADLDLDLAEYGRGRTLQPITGFRTRLIGGSPPVETAYDRPVSFGIRRCEFDHYLLERSQARLLLGQPIADIRRDADRWIVNDAVRSRMLVGAGGHFCPVARKLNESAHDAPIVVAQEAEFPIDAADADRLDIAGATPELYFSPDLHGYGWCFRKQNFLNIGFGSLDRHRVARATERFASFLRAARKIPTTTSWRWRGHAYLLSAPRQRRVTGDAVVLIGDAAGLAYPQSGEGIRPAIESGLLAAAAIVGAKSRYRREDLAGYGEKLRARFGMSAVARMLSNAIPHTVSSALAPSLFASPWFVRHVLLDRWFLHVHERSLAAA
jgi:flavin-dependent dehydrogenase